jgi:DNA-binding CsgD family transcriptional regulator
VRNPKKLGLRVVPLRPIVDVVATERALARCGERLAKLSDSHLDSESLRREAVGELQRIVGFDRWCVPLADPETLVPHSGLAELDFGPGVPRMLELEYSGDNYVAKHVVARRQNTAGSLIAEAGGDPARSARWDEVMRPAGVGDVMSVACRDALGCWGWIEAYRDSDDRQFGQQDLDLLTAIGPSIGSALRRRTMDACDVGVLEPTPPGMIVLDKDLHTVSWTAGARAWIEALPSAKLFAQFGMLPSAVYPTATIARAGGAATSAHALLRAVDGRWVMIEAARLEGEREGDIAVNIRRATATETFDLLCRAYALSRRERQLVELLVDGFDTRAIAHRLAISPHTIQDHLKSVFEKTGIHSRRELLAKLAAPAD